MVLENLPIVSLDEDEEKVNLLVYGQPGVGKTVFAGSADRVLFIAPEDDGTISAKRSGSKADKYPIKKWEALNTAYQALEEAGEEIRDRYDWIVIDSITEMQRMLMRTILAEGVADNPQRNPDVPEIQDWLIYQNRFLRFVNLYNSLPVNILWTALVRSEEDADAETILVPDIQGKGYQMSMSVCSLMTSFGYMDIKRVPKKNKDGGVITNEEGEPETRDIRFITWENNGVVQGKDRTQTLAPRTVNKNLQQINDLIFGKDEK